MYYSKLFLVFLSVFVRQVFLFEQNQYRIIHEKVTIEDFNPDIIENPVITLFKYNDTSMAFNSTATLKSDLNNDIWAHVKIYQSEDGDKYHPYPGKYVMNLCEVQKENIFGTRDLFEHSNITDCPIAKGTYYVSNYKPDEAKFPPFVPRGKLLVDGEIFHGEVYLGRGRWYGTIESI